jgi:tRNA modification GTPase
MIGITTDAINVSVDCAIEELSVLTGEKATETVVNEVFKNFCVGK